jgi:hypothetical protein
MMRLSGRPPAISAPMNNEEKQKNYDLAEKLLSEQHFVAAVIGGVVATVLAAAAFGIVVTIWRSSYAFAAAGVGLIVGASIGFLGRGISTKFAVLAAFYTIAGGVLGNLLWVALPMRVAAARTLLDALPNHSLSDLAGQVISRVSFFEFLCWFVAVLAAVFLARRSLSRSERLAVGLFELRD